MILVLGPSWPRQVAKLLAALSIACFWLLPLSPFISMAAVSVTDRESDWSRKAAVAGAVLCALYTVGMAFLIVGVYLQVA
jgi:hypothetical protein